MQKRKSGHITWRINERRKMIVVGDSEISQRVCLVRLRGYETTDGQDRHEIKTLIVRL